MEYTKEQFRKQVKVGMEYAAQNEIPVEGLVDHLTDHLWGTIGMVLQNVKQVNRREYYYNEPVRVDGDEIEGQDLYEEADPDGPAERYGLHL